MEQCFEAEHTEPKPQYFISQIQFWVMILYISSFIILPSHTCEVTVLFTIYCIPCGFPGQVFCEQLLGRGLGKSWEVYICSRAVSSVSYLYTHLNWARVDLDDVWLGNLIWPSGANLPERGWDLIGSSLLIRGCEWIVLHCPWQTVGLLWWKRAGPSQPGLPISTVPPFSLTVPLFLATTCSQTTSTSFLSHSPHFPP